MFVEVAEVVAGQLLGDEALESVDREKTATEVAPAAPLLPVRQAQEIAGLQRWALEAALPKWAKPVDHLRWRVALGVERASNCARRRADADVGFDIKLLHRSKDTDMSDALCGTT